MSKTKFSNAVIIPSRIESKMPSMYRLMKKGTGELVLQGAYEWSEGMTFGVEWRDEDPAEVFDVLIKTIKEATK